MGFGPPEQKQVFSPCLVRSPLNHLGEKNRHFRPTIRGKTPCSREETVFGSLLCQYFAELDAFLSWIFKSTFISSPAWNGFLRQAFCITRHEL